ncbi:MAG: hypothetical protein EXS18_03180 [Verrucomicrobiae bacterium]|nr:hypothetical protein [Verrucomicrobiae bacterium]
MPIKIDLTKKAASFGVSDLLAEESSRVGAVGGLSTYARMAMGRIAHEGHQKGQGELVAGYRKEIFVKHPMCVDDFDITIQGRIDGVYERDGQMTIEEIKTVVLAPSQFTQIEPKHFPTYTAQLQLYCYFLSKTGFPNVAGHLIFINVADSTKRQLDVSFSAPEVEQLIADRIRAFLHRASEEERLLLQRRELSPKLEFPFEKPRKHQEEMIQAVTDALDAGRHLMVSAPSGIGKTAGSLFPVLKYALASDKKVFFVTAKTTQQEIVWDTIGRMSDGGRFAATQQHPSPYPLPQGERESKSALERRRRESSTPGAVVSSPLEGEDKGEGSLHDRPQSTSFSPSLSALRLRAKEKMCINDVYACHEEFCQYLRDFDSKLNLTQVVPHLLEKRLLDPDMLMRQGQATKLCPFDLALIMGKLVDVHVCDYNYVFDPSVYLKHFFQDNRHRDKILIIDEAHNLYSRAMDYYSPSLVRKDIRELLERLPHEPRLAADLGKWLRSIDAEFRELSKVGREDHGNAPKYEVELPVAFFERKRDELEALTIRYHLYRVTNKIAAADDPFEAFFATFYYFTNVLALKGDEFSYLFDKTEGSQEIKILCKCPARQLRARLNGFHSVIAMSATLEPMDFYRDVLGFDADRTDSLALPSPFPSQHRKIVVIPSLSTTYKMRARSYTQLASTIARIVQTRRGNYAAFFPSFEYLRAVEPILRQICPYALLVQERDMNQEQRDELLLQIREQRDRLILAVQGGLFSEGVDFPGEQLIGVIVVSPALPTVSFERELMRRYYDENYDYRGFEYAYLYPGMSRVIQSVGRLIRTETDRGIAALICQRFATPQYNRLFPRDWYEQDVEELCPLDWEAELVDFWEMPFGKG